MASLPGPVTPALELDCTYPLTRNVAVVPVHEVHIVSQFVMDATFGLLAVELLLSHPPMYNIPENPL